MSVLTGSHDHAALGAARQRAIPTDGRDIVIRAGAWVATNAVILGPCEIGAHAAVAAGSIVNRDVPAYAIVAGNPARVVGTVEERSGSAA